jgi:crotonobetainyl-CoA:carnitine CoA-transferase CaiB-like acyl-CoA transferase
VPVLTLHEAVAHPQTEAAGVIVNGHGDDGTAWPMLASPIELSASPARVTRALGALDSDASAIRSDWQVG